MYRWTVLTTSAIAAILLILGCAGGGNDPLTPIAYSDLSADGPSHPGAATQTHIWGYYDVSIDPDTKVVEVVPNRHVMFTANVMDFINGNPANLSFEVENTYSGPDYIDVDINVNISHPFPGLTQYNGYDVRGVFISSGIADMKYNSSVQFGVLGTDQFMLANPNDPLGNEFGKPDGYTR